MKKFTSNKLYKFVFSLALGFSAAQEVFASNPGDSSNSKLTVYKHTKTFIDIEAPTESTWIGCSSYKAGDSNSSMIFYVLDKDISYEFYIARGDYVKTCLKTEKEYRSKIKGAKSIRIVGTFPHESPPSRGLMSPQTPARFGKVSRLVTSEFARLQAGNKCKAFFVNNCDLPKNYWANVIGE